jgi:hypothetical protein
MDFFKNLLNKAGSFITNIFSPKKTSSGASGSWDPQQDPNFLANMQRARESISQYGGTAQVNPEQVNIQYPSEDYNVPQNDFGGYGAQPTGGDNSTNFGMPNELVGALRDVNGITWQHQGGDKWVPLRETGGGSTDIVSAFVEPIANAIESWRQKLEEFDRNNPFSFDEAQARASAEERLNPYYDAELNDFMQGIRYAKNRSFEDMTRTVGELNIDASKLSERERLNTQEAIRSSEEGFAGSGLFFSGRRERATGLEEVGGLQKQEDIQTKLGRNVASTSRSHERLLEDKALQEAREKRLIGAARTTSLETDIAGQKKEAEYRRGLERLQFAGDIPGLSPYERLSLENQFYQNIG